MSPRPAKRSPCGRPSRRVEPHSFKWGASDNFLVINDASAILSREGIRSREVDRNANALSAPTLIRAYSDAGHHDEPAHGDRVAGLHSAFRTAGGRRAALGHASTMPSRGECCNALLRPPRGGMLFRRGPSPLIRAGGSRAIVHWRGNNCTETIDMHRTNRVRLLPIFVGFFRLGVVSFGGGTAGWLYREIVERRRWINDAEFLSGAALGRLMPGSGGVNLTVQVGQILHGGSGAFAAVLGLLSGPLAIILALTAGYTTIGQSPTLHAVLDGVAAAAIGLTFATGLKL